MKRLLLITIIALSASYVNAQSQQMRLLNSLDNKQFTKTNHLQQFVFDKKQEYNKKPTISVQKTLIWNWDTINTYNTSSGNLGRLIQTFDVNGNVLTKTEENWVTGAWENKNIWTYTYDANGVKQTEIYELFQNDTLATTYRYTNTYLNGHISSQLCEIWQSNAWVISGRTTLTYNGNGNLLTELWEFWQSNAWVNLMRYTFTNDANGNFLTVLYEAWSSGQWEIDYRDTYTYDLNGNMLTFLNEDYNSGAWINSQRTSYAYDINDFLTLELNEFWQSSSSTWTNHDKKTYTNDGSGKMLTGIYESWQNSAWELWFRKTYTWDNNANSTSGMIEKWNGSAWINWGSTSYWDFLFYVKDSISEVLGDCYKFEGSFVSFNSTNNVNELQINNSKIVVYPNPAKYNLTIETPQKATIEIINIQGLLIKTLQTIENKTNVDVSGLPGGVYILKLSTAEGSVVRKFIKE